MKATTVESKIKKIAAVALIKKIIGFGLSIFWLLVAGVGVTKIEEPADIAVLFFCLSLVALGVYLVIDGYAKTNLINNFYIYEPRLDTNNFKSVPAFAASVNTPVEKVRKNLVKMLGLGFFPNWFLDRRTDTLVNSNAPKVKYVTVMCNHCGASTTVAEGLDNKCEFCGAAL